MKNSKREKILKAAIKIFARDGFFNAKVEDIARQAGVATGTTYLYFKNKDDLLISIFEEEMMPIIKSAEDAIGAADMPDGELRAFIAHHLQLVEENADMAHLLQVELRQSSKFLVNYSGTKFKEYLDLISDILKKGQSGGYFKEEINSTLFKQIVFGAVDQISTNWTISKTRKISLKTSADQICMVILDGVLKHS
ncbi:TetR family transcriptional regulator [candidate division KSB1 bacterium]|nr:TetR family transcriptional regulator [candidate division KSB1 bacterium]